LLSLNLFGAPAVRADGAPLVGRATHGRRLALLALLACTRGRSLRRDRVLALLWPESSTDRARAQLSDDLYILRSGLGDDVVRSAGDEIALNAAAITSDVGTFERLLEEGQHEQAVGLVAGPLLDGFHLPDSAEFERWLDAERARFAALYAAALESLAEAGEAGGDFGTAVRWWRRLAAHDPYSGRITLRLMRALEANGDRADAIRQARVHTTLLREDLDAVPAPDVVELAERLRLEPPARPAPSPAPVDDAGAAPARRPSSLHAGTPILGGAAQESPDPDLAARSSGAVVRPRRRSSLHYAAAALVLAAVIYSAGRLRSPALPAAEARDVSVAVLPLANLSQDPRDAVFADGMTEALIATLARGGTVRVVARTSVHTLRERGIDVRSIADSLRVRFVVEGGVQKHGDRLRVQVRLIDARDGTTRWSETYDRDMDDVFFVQDDIARSVARGLGTRLAGAPSAPLRRGQTHSIAAYELYLRGSDRVLLRSDSAARTGVRYFREALALDSAYAAAWAGLARMYGRVAPPEDPDMPGRVRLELAERTARKAIALDDSLAEAHATLGAILITAGKLVSAERHLLRAVDLEPQRALTHEWLVTLRIWQEWPAEALGHARHALELEPLSPTANAELARALLFNDRCDEAIAQLEKLTALQPPLLRVAPLLAQCYARQQRWQEAASVLRPQAQHGERTVLVQLAWIDARSGTGREARRLLQHFHEQYRTGAGGAFDIAVLYAGLGNDDQALEWLHRAAAEQSLIQDVGNPFSAMIMGPHFADLRRDQRFAGVRELLAR
jgi:TolB-like protein/DNA-binding SARP family transcriptional activator/Flp pilus assembly protein TadD